MLMTLSQGVGRVGYDIYVTVNDSNESSSWGHGHHTVPLSFDSISNCKGSGNFSKYISIIGFDDINLKETTYAKEGRLKEDKRLSAKSNVNWIYIDETVTNKSELYTVAINESMPSSLLNLEEIMYRGQGINKRSLYNNNDEKIMTNYQAKKFTESSLLFAQYRNAIITAEVEPSKIRLFLGENYSTMFQITSDSDIFSEFKFKSSDEFIDESYIGSFKLNKKVSKTHSFGISDKENLDEGLLCCPSGIDILNNITNLPICVYAVRNSINFNQSMKQKVSYI